MQLLILVFKVIVFLVIFIKKNILSISIFYWRFFSVAFLLIKKAKLKNCCKLFFRGKCVFHIAKGARLSIGENFICNSSSVFAIDNGQNSKICISKDGNLKIGDFSGISNTIIQCRNRIEIGDYVKIGAGSLIMDSNFHSLYWEERMIPQIDYDNQKKAAIVIKDHAFIGARTIITKGVTIGEKSIVAAGSVVVCNIPDGQIWGGNPAKFIKKLSV